MNSGMRTAISLPDTIVEQADRLAARMQVSRNQLLVMALERFIAEHQGSDITERLNAYIDAHGQPIDPVFLGAPHRDMSKVEW